MSDHVAITFQTALPMIRPRLARRAAMLLLAALVPASTLAGQAVRDTATTDTTRKHQVLFTRGDAALALGFAALTVGMFPIDQSIAQRLENENSQANRFFDRSATGVEVISIPGAFVIGPALYAVGRLGHHPDIQDLGAHGTEAVALAAGITGVLKGVLGRARPYVTADTSPGDFALFKGFTDEGRKSFPSGHTAVAFAAASSVTSEARRIWPGHTPLVASLMYGGATLVGLSRMYHNKHWASDVVLGAGIGTFSGIKVVRYSHAHPDNLIDRVILSTSISPDGRGGGVFAWTVPLAH